MPAKPDGSCVNLAPDQRTCLIYDQRPSVCRIDRMRPAGMSDDAYAAALTGACRSLQRRYGLNSADDGA